MPDEWFRRKSWTEQDRKEFFARLKRSRGGFHNAQYATIQAYTLLITGTRDSYLAALELLDMVLAEWREDAMLGDVYHHQARCYTGLGDFTKAIGIYRMIFAIQRTKKGGGTGGSLDFGWMVATVPLPNLYDEALAFLAEFKVDLLPIHRYLTNAIKAIIVNAQGKRNLAGDYARAALKEMEVRHSGFRYHAMLGLVDSPPEELQRQLLALSR